MAQMTDKITIKFGCPLSLNFCVLVNKNNCKRQIGTAFLFSQLSSMLSNVFPRPLQWQTSISSCGIAYVWTLQETLDHQWVVFKDPQSSRGLHLLSVSVGCSLQPKTQISVSWVWMITNVFTANNLQALQLMQYTRKLFVLNTRYVLRAWAPQNQNVLPFIERICVSLKNYRIWSQSP